MCLHATKLDPVTECNIKIAKISIAQLHLVIHGLHTDQEVLQCECKTNIFQPNKEYFRINKPGKQKLRQKIVRYILQQLVACVKNVKSFPTSRPIGQC